MVNVSERVRKFQQTQNVLLSLEAKQRIAYNASCEKMPDYDAAPGSILRRRTTYRKEQN